MAGELFQPTPPFSAPLTSVLVSYPPLRAHLSASHVRTCSNYATMRFEPEAKHGANNGLNIARDLLEPIKQEFPWISYGDLWTLAGVAAVQELGGPKIPWRPGRIDGTADLCPPDGRLPDATQGADHVRNVCPSRCRMNRPALTDSRPHCRSSTVWGTFECAAY